jgi:hypothetical protein
MPSSSSNSAFRFLEEDVDGVIASGNPKLYRVTGGTLSQTTSSVEDTELRSDRGRGDSVLVSGSVSGSLDITLSHDTHQTFLEALLANTPVAVGTNGILTVADMAFNSTTHTISSATNALPLLEKGQWFQIKGAASALNNGNYRASMTTAPTIGAIVVETAVKDVGLTATAAECTISSTRIKQGNIDPLRSFTLERELADVSIFHTYKACKVSSLSLSYSTSDKISGSFGFMANKPEVNGNVSLFPGIATALDATTTPQMNSVTSTHVLLDGASLGEGCVESFSLEINANLRERRCLGAGLSAASIAADSFSVSGSGSVFYGTSETSTLYGKLLSDLPITFSICTTDSDGNAMAISIYRAKLNSANVSGGALGSDVMLALNFDAATDSTTETMIAFDILGETES